MARVAYVILTHNEPINLLGFVGSLWNPRDVFYIWVDAKADANFMNFANSLCGLTDNVHTRSAMAMTWGGFSCVATTLIAYKTLRQEIGNFSHVVLCSGTHIPLLHPDRIYDSIAADYGWMDVSGIPVPQLSPSEWDKLPVGWTRDILARVRYHHEEVPLVGMLPLRERERWIDPILHEGSQWHILKSDIMDSILLYEDEIIANYRDVQLSDEHAFQWAVSKLNYMDRFRRGDHVFMQWEGASPRRLAFQEVRNIATARRFLFARKAQTGSSAGDWVGWARESLGNADGVRYLQDASALLHSLDLARCAFPTGERDPFNPVLRALETELSTALDASVRSEKISDWRYLINTGKRHTFGVPLYLLCFADLSLGISVVPVVRYDDLPENSPLRPRLRPRFSREFVALPIGGRIGRSLGFINPDSDCVELANALAAELE